MFCTDVTSANTNKGDWQIVGGTGHPPDFVSGTWKSATTTVTCSTQGGVYDCRSVTTVGTDPQSNVTHPQTPTVWNAGPNAEAPQGGSYSFLNTTTSVQLEQYGAETRWNVNNTTLTCIDGATGNPIAGGFQSGHTYRVQLLTHDGDQNGTGGDAGRVVLDHRHPVTRGTHVEGPGRLRAPRPFPSQCVILCLDERAARHRVG